MFILRFGVVLSAVAFMFQVMVLAVPLSALVINTTNAFYFIRVCAVFFQNFVVLSLLFIPKMIRLYRGQRSDAERSNDGSAGFQRQSVFRGTYA
jgi:membrane protein implicated in regulation of membrane protease activity